MKLPFVKMEGAGNDYVYVDGIRNPLDPDACSELARELADRHFGVGGDGLIVLAPSDRADCRMLMWNADGSRGAMCGNGLRCLAKLAYDLGHVRSTELDVESDAGVRRVELVVDASGAVTGARVDMGAVDVDADASVATIDDTDWHYHRGDAGNPHAVVFCEQSPEDLPVLAVGAAFQALPAFPGGVNVEFVQVRDGALQQRTFERGSGETLACGSGATVAALAAMVTGRLPGPVVDVHLRGGVLSIRRDGSRVVMEGPARTVFTGEALLGRSGGPD